MNSILEKIYESGLKFLFPLSAEETYKLIIKEAMELIGADFGSLFLRDGNKLVRVYASSPHFYEIKNRPKGSMYQAFKQNKIMVLNVPYLEKIHPVLEKMNVRSIIVAPLSYKNVSIGVMALQSKKPKRFKAKEFSILRLFTPLVTLAIRKMQLYQEARTALETRDLFISMAAHELRTPLTTIIGYAQLLLQKLPKNNSPESRWVYELVWESKRLSLLANELLEVNRIKSGQFQYHLKECSLKAIINRALDNFKVMYPNRQINFQDNLKEKSDLVIGDFDKLIQVVNNLVENAVKYSPDSTHIDTIIKDRGDNLIIAIKDQGKGISKQEIAKIFDLFYRGEKESIAGMGLGLHLVQSIIKKHQGEIKVRSKPNQGTKVEILLPKFKYE